MSFASRRLAERDALPTTFVDFADACRARREFMEHLTGNTPGIVSCIDMSKPRISRLIASKEHEAIKKAGGF